jgi:hypothetical protein
MARSGALPSPTTCQQLAGVDIRLEAECAAVGPFRVSDFSLYKQKPRARRAAEVQLPRQLQKSRD